MKDDDMIDPIKDIEAFEYTLVKVDGNESYNPISRKENNNDNNNEG